MDRETETARLEDLLAVPAEAAEVAARPDVLVLVSLTTALLATSFSAIFIRICELELEPGGTIFNRFFIFFVAFGAGKLLWRQPASLQSDTGSGLVASRWWHWVLLVGVGVVSTLSLVLWALSLTQTTVAKSILLNDFTPVFTTLGGWFFFGKRFDRRFLSGMLVAIAGVVAIAYKDFAIARDGSWQGDLLALSAAVFLGAYFLLVEQLRDRFGATTILLWRCGVGSLLLLPLVYWQEGGHFLPHSRLVWIAAIGLGLICEGMGQRLLAACLDRLSSGFVSLFLLLEPLVGALLAWSFFGERLSRSDGVAFAVVLCGISIAQTSASAAKAVGE